ALVCCRIHLVAPTLDSHQNRSNMDDHEYQDPFTMLLKMRDGGAGGESSCSRPVSANYEPQYYMNEIALHTESDDSSEEGDDQDDDDDDDSEFDSDFDDVGTKKRKTKGKAKKIAQKKRSRNGRAKR